MAPKKTQEYERIVGQVEGQEPRRVTKTTLFAGVVAFAALVSVGAVVQSHRVSDARLQMKVAELEENLKAKPCCSWTGCAQCGIPGDMMTTAFCGADEDKCAAYCGGAWCPDGLKVADLEQDVEEKFATATKPYIKADPPGCSFDSCKTIGVVDNTELTDYCSNSPLQCLGYCAGLWCPFGTVTRDKFPDIPKNPKNTDEPEP